MSRIPNRMIKTFGSLPLFCPEFCSYWWIIEIAAWCFLSNFSSRIWPGKQYGQRNIHDIDSQEEQNSGLKAYLNFCTVYSFTVLQFICYYPKYIFQTYLKDSTNYLKKIYINLWLMWRDIFPYPMNKKWLELNCFNVVDLLINEKSRSVSKLLITIWVLSSSILGQILFGIHPLGSLENLWPKFVDSGFMKTCNEHVILWKIAYLFKYKIILFDQH